MPLLKRLETTKRRQLAVVTSQRDETVTLAPFDDVLFAQALSQQRRNLNVVASHLANGRNADTVLPCLRGVKNQLHHGVEGTGQRPELCILIPVLIFALVLLDLQHLLALLLILSDESGH